MRPIGYRVARLLKKVGLGQGGEGYPDQLDMIVPELVRAAELVSGQGETGHPDQKNPTNPRSGQGGQRGQGKIANVRLEETFAPESVRSVPDPSDSLIYAIAFYPNHPDHPDQGREIKVLPGQGDHFHPDQPASHSDYTLPYPPDWTGWPNEPEPIPELACLKEAPLATCRRCRFIAPLAASGVCGLCLHRYPADAQAPAQPAPPQDRTAISGPKLLTGALKPLVRRYPDGVEEPMLKSWFIYELASERERAGLPKLNPQQNTELFENALREFGDH